jgi:hypothetical protein
VHREAHDHWQSPALFPLPNDSLQPPPFRFLLRGPSAGMLPQAHRDFIRDPGRAPRHLPTSVSRTPAPHRRCGEDTLVQSAHLPSRRTHLPRPHTCPGGWCQGVLGRDDVAGGPSAPHTRRVRRAGARGPNGVLGRDGVRHVQAVRTRPLPAGHTFPQRRPSRPRLRTRRVSRAHPKGASGQGSRPRAHHPSALQGASPKGTNGVLGRDDVADGAGGRRARGPARGTPH